MNDTSSQDRGNEDGIDAPDDGANKSLTSKSGQYRTLNISIPIVIGLVMGACTTLVLLYFFFEYVGTVIGISNTSSALLVYQCHALLFPPQLRYS